VKFDRLSLDEGLSQISVNAILQDRRGFLWLGTQDGLNRYDGYQVTIYKHDPTDAASMADNFVVTLHEDREGMIWIVSQQSGLMTRFDPGTERFLRFLHDPDDPSSLLPSTISPSAIFEDEDGTLWMGTLGGGINLLDKATGKVRRLVRRRENEKSLSSNLISRIYRSSSGTLWIGTFDGRLRGLHGSAVDRNSGRRSQPPPTGRRSLRAVPATAGGRTVAARQLHPSARQRHSGGQLGPAVVPHQRRASTVRRRERDLHAFPKRCPAGSEDQPRRGERHAGG
jgi:ligand-binding sensor domain-containing protein